MTNKVTSPAPYSIPAPKAILVASFSSCIASRKAIMAGYLEMSTPVAIVKKTTQAKPKILKIFIMR